MSRCSRKKGSSLRNGRGRVCGYSWVVRSLISFHLKGPREVELVEFSTREPRRCHYSYQSLTFRVLVLKTKMTGEPGVMNMSLDLGVVRTRVLLTLLHYRFESEK